MLTQLLRPFASTMIADAASRTADSIDAGRARAYQVSIRAHHPQSHFWEAAVFAISRLNSRPGVQRSRKEFMP
jgi:hypothetical protein